MSRVYVLNSPVLTAYGSWTFEGPLELDVARSVVAGGFTSAVGHAGAAAFLSKRLGCEVPVNRVAVAMCVGDRALVLRSAVRLGEAGDLSHREMEDLPFEFGLLRRIA